MNKFVKITENLSNNIVDYIINKIKDINYKNQFTSLKLDENTDILLLKHNNNYYLNEELYKNGLINDNIIEYLELSDKDKKDEKIEKYIISKYSIEDIKNSWIEITMEQIELLINNYFKDISINNSLMEVNYDLLKFINEVNKILLTYVFNYYTQKYYEYNKKTMKIFYIRNKKIYYNKLLYEIKNNRISESYLNVIINAKYKNLRLNISNLDNNKIDLLEPMDYNKLIKNKFPSSSSHDNKFETIEKEKIKEYKFKNTPNNLLYEGEYKNGLDYIDDFCTRNNELRNIKDLYNYLKQYKKKDDEYQILSYNIHGFVNSCKTLKHNEFGHIIYEESDINSNNYYELMYMIKELNSDIIGFQEYSTLDIDKKNNNIEFKQFWEDKSIKDKYDYSFNPTYKCYDKPFEKETMFNNAVCLGINRNIKHNFYYSTLSLCNNENTNKELRPIIISKLIIDNKELYVINIHPSSRIFSKTGDTELKNLSKFLDKMNKENKNFIIFGDWNSTWEEIEEVFNKEGLYLTNIFRLLKHNYYDYYSGYHMTLIDHILVSDHFFFDFIPSSIDVLKINFSDHLPLIFNFKSRKNNKDILSYYDLINYMSGVYDIRYWTVRKSLNEEDLIIDKIENKEERKKVLNREIQKLLENTNVGYIYYHMKTILKSINKRIINDVKFKTHNYTNINVLKNTYLAHGISWWDTTDKYDENKELEDKDKNIFSRKLNENDEIKPPVECGELNNIDTDPNITFKGASFNLLTNITESFDPYYYSGLTGRIYIIKTIDDIQLLKVYNEQRDYNRSSFYELLFKGFTNYFKENNLINFKKEFFVRTEQKDKNGNLINEHQIGAEHWDLVARLIQIVLVPFYLLIDNNNRNTKSSEIFYGLLIPDSMVVYPKNYITEKNKFDYTSWCNDKSKDINHCSMLESNFRNDTNIEIYLPYPRKYVQIEEIYINGQIYSLNEWSKNYKNYFINKYNSVFDLINLKSNIFNINKDYLIKQYLPASRKYKNISSTTFDDFINIYNSVLNYITLNLLILKNFKKYYSNINDLNNLMKSINHSSSRFYNYNYPIIESEIVHIISLLRRFFYFQHTTNESSIYNDYYLKNVSTNNKKINELTNKINELKYHSSSSFSNDNINLINNFEKQLNNLNNNKLNKNYSLLYTPNIGNIINNYMITKNPKFEHIYKNQQILDHKYLVIFENPLIIIFDILNLYNIINENNQLLYNELIKICYKKSNDGLLLFINNFKIILNEIKHNYKNLYDLYYNKYNFILNKNFNNIDDLFDLINY